MKFEDFQVEQIYYDLHKKYGITHINLGRQFDNKKITYDDLIDIEEDFKNVKEMFDKMDKEWHYGNQN